MGRRRSDKLPAGVRIQRYKLKTTGELIEYGYFGRGAGSRRLGVVGSPAFHTELAKAIYEAELNRNSSDSDGTVRALCTRYLGSESYRRLKPRTRSDYRKLLDKIIEHFGTLSLRAMSLPGAARHIYEWRDSMASSPRRADYAVQVLKRLLSWGVKQGLIECNRAAGVERLHKGDRREKSWSDDQVTRFLETASEPMARAMILALETGQRQGDLLALTWAAISDGVIELKQAKTGQPVAIPMSALLRATLAGAPRGTAMTVLTKSDGRPWEPKGNGFRSAWRDACRAAGVHGVTFHDLRGTFVTRRLAAGWSAIDVAACTGHSIRNLGMLDSYADRAQVAKARAVRRVGWND